MINVVVVNDRSARIEDKKQYIVDNADVVLCKQGNEYLVAKDKIKSDFKNITQKELDDMIDDDLYFVKFI